MNNKFFCIILTGIFLMTGCWGNVDVNEIYETVGVGIDRSDDKYKITYQILVPEELSLKARGYTTTVKTYSVEASTISEASRKLLSKTSKKPELSHLRVIILGESLSREGIKAVLDFFIRSAEVRGDIYIVVTKGSDASDALKVLTGLQRVPSQKIHDSLESSEKYWSPIVIMRKYDLLRDIGSEGKEPILTSIIVKGNKDVGMSKDNVETISPSTEIETGTIAVFKKDKLIGWLNEKESSITNTILGKVRSTIREYPYNDNEMISLEAKKVRRKIKVVNDQDKPKIIYNEYIEGNIVEVSDSKDINDPKVIKKIEQVIEGNIRQLTENTIKRVQQEFNSDIFGFGQEIRRQQPKMWRNMKDNWDQEFPKLTVEVNVKLKIITTGIIIDPIKTKDAQEK